MARIDLAKLTKADLIALIGKMAEETPGESEASAHWRARDLPCTIAKCTKTFRTTTGRDWHVANGKHG
jgi:hypothetical protein